MVKEVAPSKETTEDSQEKTAVQAPNEGISWEEKPQEVVKEAAVGISEDAPPLEEATNGSQEEAAVLASKQGYSSGKNSEEDV